MTDLGPHLPPSLPRRRSLFLQTLGRLGCFILRWRAEGAFPDVSKAVIIVAPHTSNWDFFVGLAVDLKLDLKASFLGKHSIFVWPWKPLPKTA